MRTLHNQVDNDRLKLFPKHQQKEYLRQCDERDGGCNDAELVAEMRREGTLKQLNPADYAVPSVRTCIDSAQETMEGHGFRRGDKVLVTTHWPWHTEITERRVVSVFHVPAIRCDDGHVYPIRECKRVAIHR